jgi:hypothetical protein
MAPAPRIASEAGSYLSTAPERNLLNDRVDRLRTEKEEVVSARTDTRCRRYLRLIDLMTRAWFHVFQDIDR